MKNVLFIGNSYTYFNDMPSEYFAKIAESAGVRVNISAITRGGWTLEKHADEKTEEGAKIAAAFRENNFDFVVLQEQSLRPAVNPEPFFAAARTLAQKAKSNGAEVVFYCTWGRKAGSLKLAEYSMTHESMTDRLSNAYDTAAAELGCTVAHVGLAFCDINKNQPQIDLYNEDLSHPSKCGSFLAALTLFAKMFDFDVRKIAFGADFTKEENEALKAAAYSAAK